MSLFTTVAIFTTLSLQQSPPQADDKPKFGTVSGTVLDDRTGTPLRRARVSLRPRVSGLADMTVETTDAGNFRIAGIEPGHYGLVAARDGYLGPGIPRRGPFRMPRVFKIEAGDEIRDVEFRMEPWAVVDGKVRYFDNADPAVGIPVYLYRKAYARGRQSYIVAAQTRTDDRGYFRMHGLTPGSYTLAAIYDKPIDRVRKEDAPLDAPSREPSYASVFYPSGQRITDAMPVRLQAGQELTGLDMSLERAESIRVTGSIRDSCTGLLSAGANLEVARVDDKGALLAANAEVLQQSGEFTIRGLTPGTYVLTAAAAPIRGQPGCPARTDRRILTVSYEPISQFQLLLQMDQATRFSVLVDGRPAQDPRALGIRLEPKTPGWPILTPGSSEDPRIRRSFPATLTAEMIPQETYDIFVDRMPSVDGYQMEPYMAIAGASVTIRVSTKGAKVYGTVYDSKKIPLPGTVVTMIPESRRPQLYREGYVDGNGIFLIEGLAPGRYIAVPWLDNPPCEVMNPDDWAQCEWFGKAITVKAGESASLELDLKN